MMGWRSRRGPVLWLCEGSGGSNASRSTKDLRPWPHRKPNKFSNVMVIPDRRPIDIYDGVTKDERSFKGPDLDPNEPFSFRPLLPYTPLAHLPHCPLSGLLFSVATNLLPVEAHA
ncbi:hypothetical protein GWI33_007838 [Rhynchophorus ferrugineus]|uniref:Uncharacterized protein n=1 Tax=Rhynchophorus ferrugineus TaxID=354439 RepID=A0A834IJK6_RHYFE|nr:hypothetical protein GWI33_007838 [Rhynchophorus ferrugineus]